MIAISAFNLVKTEREPHYTISSIGQEFNQLIRQLPQLNPNEGKRVTLKIMMHLIGKRNHKKIDTLYCPSRLSKILTHHMKCPLTEREAEPYLKISHMAGLVLDHKEILESIVIRNCSRLSRTLKKTCIFYLSNPLHGSDLDKKIDEVIHDCYSEEKINRITQLSFK